MAPPYTYPLAGVFHFITHPQLWRKVLCPFLLTLAFGIFSLVLSFGYLLPLQAHALINVNCPSWLAWIVSVIFVLLESAILDILFFAIIVATFQDILFDATLKSLGMDRMFEHRVDVNGVVLCCRGMSSSVLLGLILVLAQILGWIITAPLHLIPVIGTVIACCINGWPACWGQHIHYDLEFRGLRVTESRHYAWQHRWSYCSFGAVAVALELVPFFNLLFMWTNVVGAAMWVADKYEKHEAEIVKQQQGGSAIGGSGDTSVASLYPSQRNPSSHVPSLESSEEARLLQSNTSISKDGYGSAIA